MLSGNYASSSMFTHLTYTFHELTGKTWGIVEWAILAVKLLKLQTAFGPPGSILFYKWKK